MEKKIYLVGGAVRDELLDLPIKDRDYVAVGFTIKDFIDMGYTQIGKDFPVFLDPETGYEYAIARSERSIGDSTTDFEFNTDMVSLESDTLRRDLTINSMAKDHDGNIIDYHGGQVDIQKQLLRHVSDAFFEDPVRVLRLARFRAMLPTWKIDYATKAMIYRHKHTLNSLQPDRIWKEIYQALPLPHFHVFFETLFELGVLDIIFPHIHQMTTIKEGSKYHRESSVFEHTMMMSRELSKLIINDNFDASNELKLSILFHDIAKPFTYREYGSSAGHDSEDLVRPRIEDTIKSLPKKLREDVIFLVANHIKIYKTPEMKKSKIVAYLEQYIKKQHLIEDQLSLALMDDIGRLQDTASKPKIIIDYQTLKDTVSDMATVSPKDYLESNPNATVNQIKAYIYEFRARKCNHMYSRLKSLKDNT